MAIKKGNSEDTFEGQQKFDVVWYEQQMRALQGTIDMLENELDNMRRQQHTIYVKDLETQLHETQRELMAAHRRNRRLTSTLQEAKEKLQILKEKVDQLSAPPNNYGVFLAANEDGTVDIDISGRKWRVNIDPALKNQNFKIGQEVIVNSGMNVVDIKNAERHGDVVKIKEQIDDELAIVSLRTDEERVVRVAESLKGETLKIGDNVLLNHTTSIVMEKLPKREVEDLLLEEVPDIGYADIGGLDEQIGAIRALLSCRISIQKNTRNLTSHPRRVSSYMGPPDVVRP